MRSRILPVAAVAVALFVGAAGTAALTPTAAESAVPDGALFIAPDGSDSGPCTEQAPCATFGHALTSGRTFLARGGDYVADETVTVADGSRLLAYPGETPVHAGRFWLTGGDGWEIGGLSFTWGGSLGGSDHMVKVTGGTGWRVHDSDIFGARSWANLLIAGSPDGWRFDHNRVHDNAGDPGHNGVQDHNVYINEAPSTTATGLFDHNVLFGAPRGEDLKLDGTGGSGGGAMGVDVAFNTLGSARRWVLTGGSSNRTHLHGNLFAGEADGSPWNDALLYVYRSSGAFGGNVWDGNLVYPSPGKWVGSSAGLTRGPDVDLDPELDGNWVPRNPAVAGVYGSTEGGDSTPTATPTPSPTAAPTEPSGAAERTAAPTPTGSPAESAVCSPPPTETPSGTADTSPGEAISETAINPPE